MGAAYEEVRVDPHVQADETRTIVENIATKDGIRAYSGRMRFRQDAFDDDSPEEDLRDPPVASGPSTS